MNLELFKQAKAAEIAQLTALTAQGAMPAPWNGARPDFMRALSTPPAGLPLAIIAEFKQASPSHGLIATGLSPEKVADDYARAGATCLSVLTEERFFRGRIEYLERMSGTGLPLLRKDFIFHPLQVAHTAATPAAALLLIVRLTPNVAQLRELIAQTESYGMHAVVEVFDEADLVIAREAGARLIQVNARDLNTLNTDRTACLRLARLHRTEEGREGEVWIAASALATAVHLRVAAEAGFNAALMGTALMNGGRPGERLATLLRELS